MLDTNKHVQEAACSALATLEEQFIAEHLVPRLRVILETLAKACATYGRKNLRILYDAISTLAEMAGKELADPSLLRIYMPPLIAKWQSLGDSDRDLLPLLECLTGITSAVGQYQSLQGLVTPPWSKDDTGFCGDVEFTSQSKSTDVPPLLEGFIGVVCG